MRLSAYTKKGAGKTGPCKLVFTDESGRLITREHVIKEEVSKSYVFYRDPFGVKELSFAISVFGNQNSVYFFVSEPSLCKPLPFY